MPKNNPNDFIVLKEIDGQTPYFIQFGKRQIHHIVESEGHKETLCTILLWHPEAKIIVSKELYVEFICQKCVKKINKKIGSRETAP